jgi:hypothetical protein
MLPAQPSDKNFKYSYSNGEEPDTKKRVEEMKNLLDKHLWLTIGLDDDEWKALDEALAKVYGVENGK